jgi:hypothetical protein
MLIFSAAITPLRRHYYAIDAIAHFSYAIIAIIAILLITPCHYAAIAMPLIRHAIDALLPHISRRHERHCFHAMPLFRRHAMPRRLLIAITLIFAAIDYATPLR